MLVRIEKSTRILCCDTGSPWEIVLGITQLIQVSTEDGVLLDKVVEVLKSKRTPNEFPAKLRNSWFMLATATVLTPIITFSHVIDELAHGATLPALSRGIVFIVHPQFFGGLRSAITGDCAQKAVEAAVLATTERARISFASLRAIRLQYTPQNAPR